MSNIYQNVYASNTAPTSHDLVWRDTNTSPGVLKEWDGSAWVPVSGGGGGSAAGADGSVQFASGGTFAANTGFTFDMTTQDLTLSGDLIVHGVSIGEDPVSQVPLNIVNNPNSGTAIRMNASAYGGKIRVMGDGQIDSLENGDFSIYNESTSTSEFRIDIDHNVIIPNGNLTVDGQILQVSNSDLIIKKISAAGLSGLSLQNPGGSIRSSLTFDEGSGEVRNYVGFGGYFPTFYSNNAEVMRISTGGNLSIGTTSDNGNKLQINGNASIISQSTPTLTIEATNSNDHGVLRFTPTGTGIAFIDNSTIGCSTHFRMSDASSFDVTSLILSPDGQLLASNGSVSTPSIGFINSPGTGFYYDGFSGDGIWVTDGGHNVINFRNTAVYSQANIFPGTDATNSFGAYNLRWDNAYFVKLSPQGGSAAVPPYNFDDGSENPLNSGMFAGSGFIGLTVETSEKMRINTNGNILIGNTSDNGSRLQVYAPTLTGSTSTSPVYIAQEWNTSAVVSALIIDVTDTASDDGSLLLDCRNSGTPVFAASKNGNIVTTDPITTDEWIFGPSTAHNGRFILQGDGPFCFNESIKLGDANLPTAQLHIVAGTVNAGTAPIKLTPGPLMTTPELGALEFTDDGTTGHLYFTRNVAGILTRTQII